MLTAEVSNTIRTFAVVGYVTFTIGLFVGVALSHGQRADIATGGYETPCMKRARLAEEARKNQENKDTD